MMMKGVLLRGGGGVGFLCMYMYNTYMNFFIEGENGMYGSFRECLSSLSLCILSYLRLLRPDFGIYFT